jgi:hypothetical protein
VLHAGIFEFDRIHEVMQSHMRISPAQARQQGGHQAAEGDEWISAECAEQKIEPDNIGLQMTDVFYELVYGPWIVERPATQHSEAVPLLLSYRKLVRKHSEAEKGIALQFLRDMKSVFAQTPGAGRESCDQANLH